MLRWSNKRQRVELYFSVLFVICCLLFCPSRANSSEIIGPEIKIQNNEIHISASLSLDEKQILELKNGISKEITFYIDLFRVWNMWPDEFVLGKKIIKTLKSDPIKKEYVATSFDGVTLIEKRFNELDSLLKWSLNVRDIKLTNTKELEPDDYFIRTAVESRLRRLPPVIGYLFFFMPEIEFKNAKDSEIFHIGNDK